MCRYKGRWIKSTPTTPMNLCCCSPDCTQTFATDPDAYAGFVRETFSSLVRSAPARAASMQSGRRSSKSSTVLPWSGLAIKVAVTLERARLDEHGALFLRRAKTGTPVYVSLPPRSFLLCGNYHPPIPSTFTGAASHTTQCPDISAACQNPLFLKNA